jgi:hypothetical protein
VQFRPAQAAFSVPQSQNFDGLKGQNLGAENAPITQLIGELELG